MAKGTVEKRLLTDDEAADAKRLKLACEEFKQRHPHATQAWLAQETNLGKQSLIGQYLNGLIQLNPKAVLAFARVLEIHPSKISPRMEFPGSSDELTTKEAWIISSYRAALPVGKMLIEGAVNTSLNLGSGIGESEANSADILRK